MLRVLADIYRTSREAPEAFRSEYETTTSYVLMLLASSDLPEVERAVAAGGENALHCAAGSGCLEVCEYLLRASPKLNFQQDSHGHTPLLWAVRHGLYGAVQLLLQHGAVVQHADRRGLTALHWAAALGYPRICQLLFSSPGVTSEQMGDRRCSRGWTPLHSAAYGGSAECCQILLDVIGANINLRTPGEEWTSLHLAAMKGNAEALEVLAPRASAEVLLALDVQGRSARDLAIEFGHKDAALVLQDPEEAHERLVQKWSKLLDSSGAEIQLRDLLDVALGVEAPELERVGKEALELSCHVTDLEFRITGYVLEVRCCDGPDGAAPSRVYYARSAEQRKLERVQFLVPRLRPNGLPLWEMGGSFRFRVTGCCERGPQRLPARTIRQVTSSWSEAYVLHNCRRRPSSRQRVVSKATRPRWPPAMSSI